MYVSLLNTSPDNWRGRKVLGCVFCTMWVLVKALFLVHTSTTCRDQTQTHTVYAHPVCIRTVCTHPLVCMHAHTVHPKWYMHMQSTVPAYVGLHSNIQLTSIPQTHNPLSCTQPVKSTLTIPNHSVPACVLAEWAPTAKQQSLGPSLLCPATRTLFICMFYPCLLALVQLEAVTQCLAWLRTTMSPVHTVLHVLPCSLSGS